MLMISVDGEARERLADGVNLVADIVKKTLGVKGRNVALDIDKHSYPLLTNDGVSIAHYIRHDDSLCNVGAKLIKEAAHKTEDNAGDGTTTTMILMQSLVEQGIEAIISGKDPLDLRAEIEESVEYAIKQIKAAAKPAKNEKTLAQTATISCRDPKIGKLVANVVYRAGEDGMITLEDNLGGKTDVQEQVGLQLLTGFAAKQFVTDKSQQQVVLDNPSFLVTNMNLDGTEELNIIAEKALQQGHKVLVVFAQNVGAEFMMWCHLNWQRQDTQLKVLPVVFNTAADLADGMLRDVAAVTGATFIDTLLNQGLEQLDNDNMFGRAKKFVQTLTTTTVQPNKGKNVDDRIDELRVELKAEKDYRAENIKERIARLRSACFTVRVGGSTITELRERKTRVQDALNSAKSAFAEGVVAGGGLTLHLIETDSGIVKSACNTPFKQLARNSGVDTADWGVNILSNSEILDPAKVIIEALRNASIQAIQLLLCETVIVDTKVNEE